jgi:glucose/arabinose dehydrogenase
LAAALGLAACAPAEPEAVAEATRRSALHDFRVVTVVDGLVHPFAMAFTPEGDMLVTERPGRLRVVRDGALLSEPVQGIPDVLALGLGAKSMNGREQAGMRDVVLHPDFASNRLLYLSYTKPGPDSLGSIAVSRGRLADGRLIDLTIGSALDIFGGAVRYQDVVAWHHAYQVA